MEESPLLPLSFSLLAGALASKVGEEKGEQAVSPTGAEGKGSLSCDSPFTGLSIPKGTHKAQELSWLFS